MSNGGETGYGPRLRPRLESAFLAIRESIAADRPFAQLGFPRSIRLRRLRTTNWPELWHFMVAHGLPDCLPPLDLDVVNVLSLHPLS